MCVKTTRWMYEILDHKSFYKFIDELSYTPSDINMLELENKNILKFIF